MFWLILYVPPLDIDIDLLLHVLPLGFLLLDTVINNVKWNVLNDFYFPILFAIVYLVQTYLAFVFTGTKLYSFLDWNNLGSTVPYLVAIVAGEFIIYFGIGFLVNFFKFGTFTDYLKVKGLFI